MHLAIQQGVDKINSLQADMLLSEEIDIELNKSMSRFLNTKYGKGNKYGKGFEESQKRIDDLRTLVNEYEAPTVFKEQYSNDFWIDTFKLPPDYLYLVNQRSELIINDCEPISYYLDDGEPTAYFILPFSNLYTNPVTGATTDFISSMQMVADPDNPTYGQAGVTLVNFTTYTYPGGTQNLKDALTNSANFTNGFSWFWETYGELDVPGAFIVVVDLTQQAWFNWDSSNPVTTDTSEVTQLMGAFAGSTGWLDPSNPTVYAQYDDDTIGAKRIPITTGEDAINASREFAFNKFVQQDDIFKLLDDPFNTTKYTSPLTTMRKDYIDIYTSDIFIIDKVKITYIRKPQQISLTLGVSCELPEHTHQEIVDMTVSSILEGISDPRYKTHQLEVSKNE